MQLIKIYLYRAGCLLTVAIAMIVVTVLVRMITKLIGMDSAESQKIAENAGEWVGKGLFAFAMIVGLSYWIFVFLKSRKLKMPPALPPASAEADETNNYSK